MSRKDWSRSARAECTATPAELRLFKRAADAAGLSLSAWMRSTLKAAAERELRRAAG